MCYVILKDAAFANFRYERQYHHKRVSSSYRFECSYPFYRSLTFSGNKYELIRHPSGIYLIQKATEQDSSRSNGSSDVQRLVEDQNRLKYQLKVTRLTNQRLRKTVFELESKMQV